MRRARRGDEARISKVVTRRQPYSSPRGMNGRCRSTELPRKQSWKHAATRSRWMACKLFARASKKNIRR
jgi:hypothetical protein